MAFREEPVMLSLAGRARWSEAAAFPPLAVVAGFDAAWIAGLILDHWFEAKGISKMAMLPAAAVCVLADVAAGAAGTYLLWTRLRGRYSVTVGALALGCSASFAWVPAVVILYRQDSAWAALASAAAAAILAFSLRWMVKATQVPVAEYPLANAWEAPELFAQSMQPIRGDASAAVMALCIYAVVYAVHQEATMAACAAASVWAFVLTRRLMVAAEETPREEHWRERAWRRTFRSAGPAIVTTMVALLLGMHSKATPRNGAVRGDAAKKYAEQLAAQGIVLSGYKSIILWPVPVEKKTSIIFPSAFAPPARAKDPIVIHFDGSYWYFQPPYKEPGAKAHVARGNPLEVTIRSTDFLPLVMQAHQNLGGAISLNDCGAVEVAIENNDNAFGGVALGVVLSDSVAAGRPTLYLGQQPVVSSEAEHFRWKPAPVHEVVRFAVPSSARLRKFDEVTILFLPDADRARAGVKMAIDQLEFKPR